MKRTLLALSFAAAMVFGAVTAPAPAHAFFGFRFGNFPNHFSIPKHPKWVFKKPPIKKPWWKHKPKVVKKPEQKWHNPGRKGPGPLASYALAATWCSSASLVLGAMVANGTERRPLTPQEAYAITASCFDAASWRRRVGHVRRQPALERAVRLHSSRQARRRHVVATTPKGGARKRAARFLILDMS